MTTRICTGCGKEAPIEQFRKLHGDGFSSQCEACRSRNREAMRKRPKELRTAQHKEWRSKTKEKRQTYMRAYSMQYWHGINIEQYEELVQKQEGKCLICESLPIGTRGNEYLHIDHNHETGEVRGLLCSSCNTALGLLKDNPEVLKRALQYMSQAKTGIFVKPTRDAKS